MKLPGQTLPRDSGRGNVSKNIRGVLVTGDFIDSSDKSGGNYSVMQKFEWNRYQSDYGQTGKDGEIPFPVYELPSNHDGPPGDTFVVKDIIERNRPQPGLNNLSTNTQHIMSQYFLTQRIKPGRQYQRLTACSLTNLYPVPRTETMYFGFEESSSIIRRRRITKLSIVLVVISGL